MLWRKHHRASPFKNRRANPSEIMNVESQLALDETVARALQYVEDKLAAATSLTETTATESVLQETTSGPANSVTTSVNTSDLDASQDDIDPDIMTYEELQSLGEAIGTESRGLSDELISFLESSIYKEGFFSSQDEYVCVICCSSFENEDLLITLPCKHHYHSHCIKPWLKINKACPICNVEAFGS
uniref:E3 ubiquitin ligase BIG BROTHER n=1 Tax=Anthurium amnicola TaxID=1678845 RepID=A0A1D1Y6W3_9ARAE